MHQAGGPINAGAMPTVTIVINSFNDARWLPDSIESALAQTRPADEIIVIDDGSAEDPSPVIAPYPGVRLVRQANAGLAGARNTGIAEARSDYILFLDADDRLKPEAIETGLACFAANPDAGFVYGGHHMTNQDGSRRDPDRFERLSEHPYRDLLRGNLIAMHAAVLYRRDRLQAAGGFDASLRRCEDYDLYLRMARNGPIACHPDVIAEYRWHDDNMSHDINAMLDTVLSVHKRHEAAAARDPEDHAAWRAGQRNWRDYYEAEMRAAKPSLRRRIIPALRRRARERLSPQMKRVVRKLAGKDKSPLLGHVRFGDFGTTTPVSQEFGFDRGLPIDRYYIESFLERNRADIKGRVLEVGDDAYSRRYGGKNIARQDILHAAAGNPIATIVGGLPDDALLERDAYDCMVLTQVLHFIFEMKAALHDLHDALRPGGVMLLTVPGITPVERTEWTESWYWSLTKSAATRLVGEVFGEDNIMVEQHGNVFAATAFIQGVALEEVDRRKLDVQDPAYPVIVTVRAVKAAA